MFEGKFVRPFEGFKRDGEDVHWFMKQIASGLEPRLSQRSLRIGLYVCSVSVILYFKRKHQSKYSIYTWYD